MQIAIHVLVQESYPTFILVYLACLTTTSSCLQNHPCIQSILYTFLYPFITSHAFNPKNIHSLLHFYTHIHLILRSSLLSSLQSVTCKYSISPFSPDHAFQSYKNIHLLFHLYPYIQPCGYITSYKLPWLCCCESVFSVTQTQHFQQFI